MRCLSGFLQLKPYNGGAGCRKTPGYLNDDPLNGLAPFDKTPQDQRRAMTPDEIGRLLKRGCLCLDAQWTKNRKSGYQPVPRALVQRLHAFAESGEPAQLYTRNFRRGGSQNTAPVNPLLYVPSHPARILDQDLEAAGIPKRTAGGKLDFHACRIAYVNLVFEYGNVSPKEAQDLARHSTPDLTFNVYGRTRDERLSEAVERLAEAVFPLEGVPREYQLAVGAETESATPFDKKRLRSIEVGSGGRARTNAMPVAQSAESTQKPAETEQFQSLPQGASAPPEQSRALSRQSPGNILRQSSALLRHSPDLSRVIDAWDDLPEETRSCILKLIEEAHE